MSSGRALLEKHRDEILRLARCRGARNVRVFGSVARGEDSETSDLDVLVDLEPGRGLLDLGGLTMDLRDLLSMDVDVFTPSLLKERIRGPAMKEAVPL